MKNPRIEIKTMLLANIIGLLLILLSFNVNSYANDTTNYESGIRRVIYPSLLETDGEKLPVETYDAQPTEAVSDNSQEITSPYAIYDISSVAGKYDIPVDNYTDLNEYINNSIPLTPWKAMHIGKTKFFPNLIKEGLKIVESGGPSYVDIGDTKPGLGGLMQLIDKSRETRVPHPSWFITGTTNIGRMDHTATLIPGEISQKAKIGPWVIITGGIILEPNFSMLPIDSCEIYDVQTGSWKKIDSMWSPRDGHTATLLDNGEMIVTGGVDDGDSIINSVEIYNPRIDQWRMVAPMETPRVRHTATLLPNGKVLVVGGFSRNGITDTAEIYDPGSDKWKTVDPLSTKRAYHTATLTSRDGLPRILIAGGWVYPAKDYLVTNTAELFDPINERWIQAADMVNGREEHATIALNNGMILVTGGFAVPGNDHSILNSAELYDPQNDIWIPAADLLAGVGDHVMTMLQNGDVLMLGGVTRDGFYRHSSYIYNPQKDVWTRSMDMDFTRPLTTATTLPDGNVLVAAGVGDGMVYAGPLPSFAGRSEVFVPKSKLWAYSSPTIEPRFAHAAVLMQDGNVLVAGGGEENFDNNRKAEVYSRITGKWYPVPPMKTARSVPKALQAGSSIVLFGGEDELRNPIKSCELFDPSTHTWSDAAPMNIPRLSFTATVLQDGRILVTGGSNKLNYYKSAEIYDPITDTWEVVSDMAEERTFHSAVLLPNGDVLVTGGFTSKPQPNNVLNSAEIYDHLNNTWKKVAPMNYERVEHATYLLPNGKVIAVGGNMGATETELYDPVTNKWSLTGKPGRLRKVFHVGGSTQLHNGNILIVGNAGFQYHNLATAEIYDVITAKWYPAGSIAMARVGTATTLWNGKVLFVGGQDPYVPYGEIVGTRTTEMFIP